MHNEKVMRFLGTDSVEEFGKWINYMKDNNINFKSTMKRKGPKWKCEIELMGYSSEEIEIIKNAIGFYLD